MRLVPRRLVVTGSVIVDILLYLASWPEPGSAAVARQVTVAAGAGYNLLVGAVRLGLPAACGALVGSGVFGRVIQQALTDIAVPLLLPPRDDDSGFDVGLVTADAGGQPTFIGSPGAESKVTLADLEGLPLRHGDAVHVSGYDLWYPDAGAALTEWAARLGPGYLLVFDPGPLAGEIEPARTAAVIGRTDILTLNLSEASALASRPAGPHDPAALAAALAGQLPAGGWVVMRAGAAGCWVASPDTAARHIPPRPATVVDPTGAGDAHTAALLARLAAGQDMAEAARWANAAASLAIGHVGPATGPTAIELADALAQCAGDR